MKAQQSLVISKLLPYILSFLGVVASVGILLALIGKNPFEGYRILLSSSLGSPGSLSLTLLDFVPLFLMALAFVVPLRAGKYNVGNEGQFLLGAVGAVTVSFVLPNLPSVIGIPLLLVAGMAFGSLWAVVPAFLLYRFRVNEIVSTISMNFIAYYLVLFVTTGPWHNPLVGYPQTNQIGSNYILPSLVRTPQIGTGLIITVLAAAIVYFYISKTPAGFELRAVGANPRASLVYGIKSNFVSAMSIVQGAAIAGLAGAIQVAGLLFSLQYGMQGNYGLLSLVPALISASSLIGVGLISFFIAVIDTGTSALQGVLGVPYEIGLLIESLLLLLILLAKGYGGSNR
ncbi:MAG: ABC transporter permease [Nitrososphaerota archaeon]|nr:ABC transporter permease [Nitrososphaerota archaeon]